MFTARIWKQPRCPSTDEWIRKMWCIHTDTHTYIYTHTHTHTHTHTPMEYYSVVKKNEFEI